MKLKAIIILINLNLKINEGDFKGETFEKHFFKDLNSAFFVAFSKFRIIAI